MIGIFSLIGFVTIIVSLVFVFMQKKKKQQTKQENSILKTRFSFNTIIEKLIKTLKRFPISILLIFGFAVLIFIDLNGYVEKSILIRLCCFFSIGTFLGIALTLFLEDFFNWLKINVVVLIILLLWGIYCFFLPKEIESLEKFIELIILGATAFFAVFFMPFLKKEKDIAFWNFTTHTVSQMVLACFFGGIFFGGLSLALFAIQGLFDISFSDKIFGNLAIFCFVIFSPIYFLSNIPDKTEKQDNELSYNKIQKILALYIFTPILAVYAVILYVYLFKIIFIWELPNGLVSWLVSILALGGLLIILFLYPIRIIGENKFVVFLSHWFGIFIAPLIILMTVGIFKRISDYGITIFRIYILLLNLWFYGIYIYLFLNKAKRIKWILISIVAIALISSTGFWSVANIVKYSLTKELKTILKSEKRTIKEASVFLEELDPKEKEKFIDKFEYLGRKYGMASVQPFFYDTVENLSYYTLFTKLCQSDYLSPEELGGNYFYFNKTVSNNEVYNISKDFNCFAIIYYYENLKETNDIQYSIENGDLEIKIKNQVFRLPLKTLVKNHKEEDINFIREENFLFLFRYCNGFYYEPNDSIKIDQVEGYLFYNLENF